MCNAVSTVCIVYRRLWRWCASIYSTGLKIVRMFWQCSIPSSHLATKFCSVAAHAVPNCPQHIVISCFSVRLEIEPLLLQYCHHVVVGNVQLRVESLESSVLSTNVRLVLHFGTTLFPSNRSQPRSSRSHAICSYMQRFLVKPSS